MDLNGCFNRSLNARGGGSGQYSADFPTHEDVPYNTRRTQYQNKTQTDKPRFEWAITGQIFACLLQAGRKKVLRGVRCGFRTCRRPTGEELSEKQTSPEEKRNPRGCQFPRGVPGPHKFNFL